jgi:hypothetical protein
MTQTQLKQGIIDNWDAISKEVLNYLLAQHKGLSGATPTVLTHAAKPNTSSVTLTYSDTLPGSKSGVIVTIACT